MSKTGCRKGFTLIELLVVIAIIAILAAILFPIFTAAQENARRTKCMSQLKQIGVATLSYADDYHGYLPVFSTSDGSECYPLTYKLRNYVGGAGEYAGKSSTGVTQTRYRMWCCPSDNGWKPLKIKPSYYVMFGSSYMFNWNIYLTAAPIKTAKMVSSCRSSKSLILYWDEISHPTGSTWVQNTAYGDGHVCGIPNASLSKGVNGTSTLF